MEIKNKVMECKEGNGQWKPVQSTDAVGSIDEQVVHESSPTIDLRGLDTDDDVVDHQLLPSVSTDSNSSVSNNTKDIASEKCELVVDVCATANKTTVESDHSDCPLGPVQ